MTELLPRARYAPRMADTYEPPRIESTVSIEVPLVAVVASGNTDACPPRRSSAQRRNPARRRGDVAGCSGSGLRSFDRVVDPCRLVCSLGSGQVHLVATIAGVVPIAIGADSVAHDLRLRLESALATGLGDSSAHDVGDRDPHAVFPR